MTKKKKKKKNKSKEADRNFGDHFSLLKFGLHTETKKGIFFILILMFSTLSLVGLFGLGGNIGDSIADILSSVFGYGKWMFPLILFIWGGFLYKKGGGFFKFAHYLGLIVFIVSLQSLLHLFYKVNNWRMVAMAGKGGGSFGYFFASFFYDNLSFWGSLIVLSAMFIVSTLFVFNTTLDKVIGKKSIIGRILFPIRLIFSFFINFFKANKNKEHDIESDEIENNETSSFFSRKISDSKDDKHIDKEKIDPVARKNAVLFKEKQGKKILNNNVQQQIEKKRLEYNNLQIDIPLDLLSKNKGNPVGGDVKKNSAIIKNTLKNFNIPVIMDTISVGPSVTQYTLKPAEGVKVSRIINLSNDLALTLAAHPIRIEAPIPGKALVGIEVPNTKKAIVNLRSLLNSKQFKNRKNNLMMAIGEDVAGQSWMANITKMPHLLIAGATNSGKSVCIHSIIVSLLYQNDPDDLQFIMVDPKRLELPIYNGIPHLLTPVIVDTNKTINALKWCLNEMDRRFDVLSKAGKRNITLYNETADEKMPYIVFIIDELADLMIVAAREIESYIIRLTQMARAVGIHLILATQRPSVDIITGLIKANVPSRIALSVASGVDSRTILDSLGAEKLIGQGDMLFLNPEMSKPKRIQGVFVSDLEVKRVVNYIIEKSGDFQYNDDVIKDVEIKSPVNGLKNTNNEDSLFEAVKEEVVKSGRASATYLQRRFKIGFARASGLIDSLEEIGIIGPKNGSKPREVLITQEDYASLENIEVSDVDIHNKDEAVAPDNYLEEDNDNEEDGVKLKFKNKENSQETEIDD